MSSKKKASKPASKKSTAKKLKATAKTQQEWSAQLFAKAQQDTRLAYERDLAKIRAQLKQEQSLREQVEAELTLANARNLFADSLQIPTPVSMQRLAMKPSGEATAILVLSDWHVEETVDPATVNYLNEFNLDIAAARIKRTFEKAVTLIEAERQMSNIRDLVVAILGDIITGYIHDELVETNSLSPTEACIFAEDHITGGLNYLKKESGCKSIIVPTALGNHGRTTPKMRISSAHANSYEWYMYKHLERCYRNDPIIKWKVENSYHNWLPVQGKDMRFHHGTPIKYKGGINGASVPILRKISQWNMAKYAWWDVFGHLHIYQPGEHYLANPSLIGYSALSEIFGGFWPPMQSLMIVDRSRSIPVSVKPIFCEEKDFQQAA